MAAYIDIVGFVSLLSFLITLFATPFVYLRSKKHKGHRSLSMFVFGFLVVGILFYVIGFAGGCHLLCQGADPECGLVCLLITGPALFSLSIGCYLYAWANFGRKRING